MTRRGRILYCILALFLSISLTYRVREIADRLALLLNADEHVRNPLNITLNGDVFTLTPEAEMAGLQKGDRILVFAGRPYRGIVDFVVPLFWLPIRTGSAKR
jgi:hypothetical protein